ncbi:RloB family protein [Endozoicomonas sp. 2B-B]
MPPKKFRAHRSIKRKASKKKQPKLKIYAYCEGKNTEPQYLKQFSAMHSNGLVSVETVGAAGVPKTIVDKASEKKCELAKAAKKSGDPLDKQYEVWAVFDRDEHPNISQAFDKAHANSVNIGYSNPCFELWPYLHFVDHSAPIHRKALQAKLKSHITGYDVKGSKVIDPRQIDDKYKVAKQRAENLKAVHEKVGSPMESPYTDVYILLERIKQNGKA